MLLLAIVISLPGSFSRCIALNSVSTIVSLQFCSVVLRRSFLLEVQNCDLRHFGVFVRNGPKPGEHVSGVLPGCLMVQNTSRHIARGDRISAIRAASMR